MPASADSMMPAFMPPGGPMEIVFSFDTTGSMGSCIGEVRNKVTDTIARLFADIPGLKIAVFAHGDYCDSHTYVTKYVDFTDNQKKLTDFVQKVKTTGGGDWEECYELVLHQVQTQLNWSPGSQRALVMIGDAIPHDTTYPQNKLKLDWKKETTSLWGKMGVRVYAVQCQQNEAADHFYKYLAENTDGKWIKLGQFQDVVDMLMAICYREQGPDMFLAYEQEVRAREGKAISHGLDKVFRDLHSSSEDEADDAMDTTDTGRTTAAATSAGRATGRKVVKAKRGAAGTRSRKATPVPSPVQKKGAKRARDRSRTPASKVKKMAVADADGVPTPTVVTAAPPKKAAGPKLRARKSKHPMSLRPRVCNGRSTVVRKLIAKAKATRAVAMATKRLNREDVSKAYFSLDGFTWSPWKQAVAPVSPRRSDSWIPRRGNRTGVRNVDIFGHDTMKPAMYEFAVETPEGRKYPVLSRTTGGFNSCHWDTKLLNTPPVEAQLDRVIRRGCKLYARRALFPGEGDDSVSVNDKDVSSVQELRSLIGKTYDYAWQEHYDTTSRRYLHRTVMKDGVLISDNTRV